MNERDRFDHSDPFAAYASVGFEPRAGDAEFFAGVRRGVGVRRKLRAARATVLSSLAAVVLLAAVLRIGGTLTQPGRDAGAEFAESSEPRPGLDETEITALEQELADLTGSTEADSLTERVSSELTVLFQEGDFTDPIDYLASYDESTQDRVLARLRTTDLLAPSGDGGKRGEG